MSTPAQEPLLSLQDPWVLSMQDPWVLSTQDPWVLSMQDPWVRLRIWIGGLRQSKGVTYLVENSARMVVNRGRLLKYVLMFVVGFVCVGLMVALIDRQETSKDVIQSSGSFGVNKKGSLFPKSPRKRHSVYLQEPDQKQRRKSVTTVCKRALKNVHLQNDITKIQHIDPESFKQIYVDDRHKVLYCEVPKVACTNFKRIMLILTGKMNTTDPTKLSPSLVHGDYAFKYLKKLSSYSPVEISKKLTEYFKFMFVREPLERILSAYRNKFTKPYNDYFKVRYGRKIVEKYRRNPSELSLKMGDDVKFTEFVKYLTDKETIEEDEFNPHWRQYYKLCHPCQVKYDFIGKYESLDEDVFKLLDILNVSDLIRFPKAKSGIPTSDLTTRYFRNVTSEELHKLWKLYSVDYSMFGYKYPNFT